MRNVSGLARLPWMRDIACRALPACFLLLTLLFLNPPALADYQFERLWPTLQQDWGFEETRDIDHDAEGNIYLLELFNKTVVKETGDGRAVTEWSSPDLPDPQLTEPGRIAIDRVNGFVYVLDGGSGPMGTGVVFKFDLDGQYLSSFDASAPGLTTSILVDGDGSVLVGYEAGAGSSTALVRYDINGSVLASWDATALGIPAPIGATFFRMTRNGNNLYMLFSGTVYAFTTAGTTALTPQTTWPTTSNDNAEDLAADTTGKVWVAGPATGNLIQLVRYSPAGVPEAAHTITRQITTVRGVAILPDGNIYVASGAFPDPTIGEVDVVAPDGTPLNLWTTQGTGNGSFQDAPDVTVAANGDVYVLDEGNKLVQVFDNNGIYQSQWALDPSGAMQGGKLFVDGDIFIGGQSNLDRYNSAGVYQGAWQPTSPQPPNYDSGMVLDSIAANGRIYQLQIWGQGGGGPGGGSDIDFIFWVFEQNGTLVHEYGLQEATGQTDRLQFARLFAVDASEDVYIGIRHNSINKSGIYHYAPDGGTYGYVEETPVLAVLGGGNPFGNVSDLDVASDGTYLLSLASEQNGRMLIHLAQDGTELQGFSQSGSVPGELSLDLRAGIELDSTDRLFVADVGNRRIQVFEPVIQSNRTKAIIVAGGGPYSGNHLWSATQAMSNTAYRILTYKGFTSDNIQYLSADTRRSTVDADATKANLQAALTTWALADNDGTPGPDATDVVVYLTDHGGPGSMRISGTETVSDTEFDNWLDTVEDPVTGITGKVTLVYDACNSGSWTSIADTDRNLLLSSAGNQVSYFTGRGILSFSQFFWSEVFAGGSISDAFTAAQNGIANMPTAQDPELDADGDGIPNEQVDDIDALQNIYIGNGTDLFQAGPSVTSISAPKSIPGSTATITATITATGVTDSERVNRVWAVVYPPDLPPPDPENPVVDFPTFELVESPAGSGNYSGTYDSFTSIGIYHVVVTAQNVAGNTSAPQLTAVTVGTPLSRRAVIVVGGDPADATTWPGYEVSGTATYNALRAQGYTNSDITYLSGTTVNTVEQPVTLANLQAALAGANTQDLVLYMVGPGDGLKFTLNPGEALPAGTLDGWLNTMMGVIPGKLTVIMDADNAGIFLARLSAPAGEETNLYRLASTVGGTAYFGGAGSVSYTQFLVGNIANGATLPVAHELAKRALDAASNGRQRAWLDSNSDGSSDKEDLDRITNFSLGPGILLAGDDPVIGSVGIVETDLDGDPMQLTLWAQDMTTTGTIESVWAVVTPPDTDGYGGTEPVAVEVPLVESPAGSNYYAGSFVLGDGAAGPEPAPPGGTYSVTFYARDMDGAVSLPSSAMATRQDEYEVDNTHDVAKSIVVDGPVHYHSFHTTTDVDWAVFYHDESLNPVTQYTIKADTLGSETDIVLTLADESGATLVGPRDDTPAGDYPFGSEVITYTPTQTGFYKIKVSLASTGEALTDYVLSVSKSGGGDGSHISIEGIVVDGNGVPLTLMSVFASGPATDWFPTGFDGRYTLKSLPAGTYNLTITDVTEDCIEDGNCYQVTDIGPPNPVSLASAEATAIVNIAMTAPDNDADSIPDWSDPDDDNDGIPDGSDAFPFDTDNDGIDNALDDDDDNDGILDEFDTYPLDTDNDGFNNAVDDDDDNDGFTDAEELAAGTDPLDPASFPGTAVPGDVTGDQIVNVADIMVCTRILLGLDTTTDWTPCDVAPLDAQGNPQGDGQLNAGDIGVLQQMALGM